MPLNRRILFLVTAPSILPGLILFVVCFVSAWYVDRLQSSLTAIMEQDVTSMRAAQQMEISARQLRFRCFVYLIDPSPSLLVEIDESQQRFAGWLIQAEQTALTPRELTQLQEVRTGYDEYLLLFKEQREEVERGTPRRNYRELADTHLLQHITDPCREYLRLNEELMTRHLNESGRVVSRANVVMLLLGVVGPLGGLLSGYGLARNLTRSLHRLRVHVQDMAQHLDHDVATIRLGPDGDLGHLDKQLEHVLQRVGEVTERLRRQEAEMLRAQQLAAVGQLAAGVAHEVRNPLTSIKMLVEAALREQKPRPFTADNLHVVHGEILRLEQTVQRFLDFARPPALVRSPCDLRAIVTQAAELVRARASQIGVQIDLLCPEEAVMGEVDRGQLCTVLVNLFVNALDAMPNGGRLSICFGLTATGIQVRVIDTGAGISSEIMDRLFTPFATTKATGNGLGLSISRRIMEEHGGQLLAANRIEGGACFTLTLPVLAVPEVAG